jgi:hypothetical protein
LYIYDSIPPIRWMSLPPINTIFIKTLFIDEFRPRTEQ